eukprot:3318493-Pleurochrysis_carterae.AAC.1
MTKSSASVSRQKSSHAPATPSRATAPRRPELPSPVRCAAAAGRQLQLPVKLGPGGQIAE